MLSFAADKAFRTFATSMAARASKIQTLILSITIELRAQAVLFLGFILLKKTKGNCFLRSFQLFLFYRLHLYVELGLFFST